MNRSEFDGFYDEMLKISQVTQILRGVLTRDPRAAWRTASHAARRSGRLAKADVLRAGRGAKQTGNVEKLLAEGKINQQQAAEMMKVHRSSPAIPQKPKVFTEGTQVARPEGVTSVRGSAPTPSLPRARPAPAVPAARPTTRGGVMERMGKWWEKRTPGQRMGMRMGGTALAGGVGYGAG